MCDEVTTVATKSAQVWLQKDLKGLGWDHGPGLITALGLSFSTWADMTPTLTSERAWRGQLEARSMQRDRSRISAMCCPRGNR